MGVHDGHRERMKSRFLTHGLENFNDLNVLEMILFFAIPRRDTNVIAHELMSTFGSLEGVFEAKPEELRKIKGMGDNAVTLLKLIPQVSRRYMIRKTESNNILNSTKLAGEYLIPKFMYERDEVVYLVCLDAKCKVLCCKELGRGEVNTAEISIRKIVETALSCNATSAILAHNHTSGIALPSMEDENATLRVRQALALVGVELCDHIIVAGDDFVSMADSGFVTKETT
jgi:DNA repair protein RadC